jgi:hypothetical protein
MAQPRTHKPLAEPERSDFPWVELWVELLALRNRNVCLFHHVLQMHADSLYVNYQGGSIVIVPP